MNHLIWHFSFAILISTLFSFTLSILPLMHLRDTAKGYAENTAFSKKMLMAFLYSALCFAFFAGMAIISLNFIPYGRVLYQSEIIYSIFAFIVLLSIVSILYESRFIRSRMTNDVDHKQNPSLFIWCMHSLISPSALLIYYLAILYSITQPHETVVAIYLGMGLGFMMPHVLLLIAPHSQKYLQFAKPWMRQMNIFLVFILLMPIVFLLYFILDDPSIRQWLLFAYMGAVLVWVVIEHQKAISDSGFAIPFLFLICLIPVFLWTLNPKIKENLHWKPFNSADYQHYLTLNQKILIHFTANWCLDCKIIEKTTYLDKRFAHFVRDRSIRLFQVDMDFPPEKMMGLLEYFGGNHLPYTVFIDNTGSVTAILSHIDQRNSWFKSIQN